MAIGKELSKNIVKIMKVPGLVQSKKTSQKTGLPPGALIHVGEKKVEKTIIRMLDYDQQRVDEIETANIEQCLSFKDNQSVSWIEVYGLHDISVIEQLGNSFDIHPLVLEDILNTQQRPKFEEYDNHLYLTLKYLYYDSESETIESEQISIVTGHGYVISFHERDSDIFEPVRIRIRNAKLKIRKRDVDYLTYALVDTVVDHYFEVMENLGEYLEELDAVLLQDINQEHLQTIASLKKCFLDIRRAIWPLQSVITTIIDEEYELINEQTLLYFRDIRDHIHQIVDSLETYRDITSNVVDTYLSALSMKMNEVMKMLTIAATIFMPLTFVAGVYGMNFKFMPELEWKWGYFSVLGVMLVMLVLLLFYFKRKKWI